MSEPEIHTWWPYLSIPSKNATERVLDDPDQALPAVVRDEIELLTGIAVAVDRRLTRSERDFIRTQQEMVD